MFPKAFVALAVLCACDCWAPTRIAALVVPDPDLLEAIVVTGLVWPTVGTCSAARLLALAESSRRPVIFLVDEKAPRKEGKISAWFNPSEAGDKQGQLVPTRKLQRGQQRGRRISPFDTRRSGRSKSAFLRWAATSKFDYIWHIEEDVLYTGEWHRALALAEADRDADLVALFKPWTEAMFEHRRRIVVDGGRGTKWDRCTLSSAGAKKRCTEFSTDQTFWPVLRISRTFASVVIRQLSGGGATGHHEYLIDAVCQSAGKEGPNRTACKKAALRGRHEIHLGAFSNFASTSAHKLSNHDVQASKLYHPVKCAADSTSGSKALSWAGLNSTHTGEVEKMYP